MIARKSFPSIAVLLLGFTAHVSKGIEYRQPAVTGSGISTNYSEAVAIPSEKSAFYQASEGFALDSSVVLLCYPEGSSTELPLAIGSSVDGPATFKLRYIGTSPSSFADVEVSIKISVSGKLLTEDGIVVVPADNGNPVTIVIETSTDLENWVVAQPGNYGETDEKRFFRVRATRK